MPSATTETPFPPCTHKSDKSTNSKRLIVCCDGTWNDSNSGNSPESNVSRLSGAFAHKCCTGMPQLVYYRTGAGTEASWVARQLGGIFGQGVAQDIVECYRFICDNYNPGDEIILIGFSRGAFTARSVAAMVCALGFLNQAGLDQLPHIFRDYSKWTTWTRGTTFDGNLKDKYLEGFTVDNLLRVNRLQKARRGNAELKTVKELESDLRADKEALYNQISSFDKVTDVEKIAAAYREMLVKHEMASRRRVNGEYIPEKGVVRAVGVWDTVGSLGIPKDPLFGSHSGRGENEIRFQSLNVHENIEYAFHALALDETRTAFGPTMWGTKGNKKTKLRQVWFPGNHSNVGGGWKDQQIATIALAWMADQLTSIGVEFNRNEMQHIFYSSRTDTDLRPWGMGKICASNGVTSYPDKAYNAVSWPLSKLKGQGTESAPRKPGLYMEDDGKTLLEDPNEFVHPSVRIRYQCEGLDLDDRREWKCRALLENGYELQPVMEPAEKLKGLVGRVPDVLQPYYTVSGVTLPHFESSAPNPFPTEAAQYLQEAREHCEKANLGPPTYVRVEQPWDEDLQTPGKHFVWKHKDGKSLLPEEWIGLWERMFIKANARKMEWAATELQAQKQAKAEKEASRWRVSKWWYGEDLGARGDGNGKHHLKDVATWQTTNTTRRPASKLGSE